MKDLTTIAAEEQTLRGELNAVREVIREADATATKGRDREAVLLARLDDLDDAASEAIARTRGGPRKGSDPNRVFTERDEPAVLAEPQF